MGKTKTGSEVEIQRHMGHSRKFVWFIIKTIQTLLASITLRQKKYTIETT
jgi:hypothetical protein